MRRGLLFALLLPIGTAGLPNAARPASSEGATVSIEGTFKTTGPVSFPAYGLKTTVHVGSNNELKIDAGDRAFHARLDGSPTANAGAHPTICGGVTVDVNHQPDYAKAKITDDVLTFSILFDWATHIRSPKCARRDFWSRGYLNQEFVVDLKSGCKFKYAQKQVKEEKVVADFQIEGECVATR